MPRIQENEAFALAQGIDTLDESQRPQALDILTRYRDQQNDLGEPQWPSQVQAAQAAQESVRGMFSGGLDKVQFEVSPWSKDPQQDKATFANMAFLAHRYQKPPQEIADRYDFFRDDYARQTYSQPGGVDDKTFYNLTAKDLQKQQDSETATLDGVKAALRGDDVIPSLQAWQQKNGLERMADSTEFTKGFLGARARAGDHLEFADTLLNQIESNTGLTKGDGADRPVPASQEMATQFEASLSTLAAMKPKDRRQVYAIIGSKAEAAGYDPKGFWGQMLSELGKGMARMGSTVTTQAGVTADVVGNFPAMLTNTMRPDEFAATDASIASRHGIGEMYDEVANIVAGAVDPVKPTLSWMNDSVESGLIKGPGAVAPFMMASAALGPVGATALFTADFAEQNRRELRAGGMDNERAVSIGAAAAPLQAAVESLSNGIQLGRFPAVQAALSRFTKPIGGGQGLLGRYLLNTGVSLGTEFTEEQLQDNVIRPAVQNIAAAFDKDVPQVGMGQIYDSIKKSSPELLFTLAPMALVFGGTLTSQQAGLSQATISSQDLLEAAGYSAAQANSIRSEGTPEAQITKARDFWTRREGTPQSMEEAAKSVGERMRMLQTDSAAAQADLEQRGILPRMLHATDDRWRLTFNDGSVADFNSHGEADQARWQWANDQLGKVHLATREALAQMERNAATGREFAVEFKPDVMTAQKAVDEGRADPAQIERRVQQGEAAGESDEASSYDDATAIDKASSDYLSSLQILGSSVNTFKNDILTTTIRLYEGAHVLTLVEEKLEGDAKQIVASKPGRSWMLSALRNFEQVSGDKLFREGVEDSALHDDDLIEAWSSLGQSYLVGKSKKGAAIGKGGARRIFADVLKSGMGGAMNAETQFFNAVWKRAAKLSKLKRDGKLGDDLTSELERQLGIDSQGKHETEAAKEADAIANEALNAGGESYSEESPGPNGETFSLQGGNKAAASGMASNSGAAQSNEPSPGGLSEAEADQIASQRGLIKGFHGTNAHFKRLDVAKTAQGILWFGNDRGRIERGESGADGRGRIITAYLDIKKPAGWDEYENKSIDQLIQDGYDGVILPDPDGTDYIVFDNKQVVYPDDLKSSFNPSRADGGTFSLRKFDFSSRLAPASATLQGMRQQGQGFDFSKAYQAAAAGQSSSLLSLDSLYEQAKKQAPSLTTQQFGKQLQALYDAGHLMLEPGESSAAMKAALDLYGLRDSLGIPSMFAALMPADQTLSLRPGDFSSRMSAAFSPFQRSPELRLAIAKVAKERAMKLSQAVMEAGDVLRSDKDIEKERKIRYTLKLSDLLDARGMTLEDVARSKDQKDYESWQRFQESKDLLMKSGLTEEEATPLADASSAKWRDNIVKNVRAAMTEAKTEADQWAEGQKKAAKSPRAVRDQIKAWLRLLDGILSAAPPEVRARVGGYVKLAGLSTDEAMLKEVERRIEKLNVELEKWLRKETREQIADLFKKAEPKMKAGKKPKGSMTADAHELVELARDYSQVKEADMGGERKKLEDAMFEPDADLAEIAGKMQVLELFGGMNNMNASSLDAALHWLRDVVETGRDAWRMANDARVAAQRADAKDLQKDTGKAGDISELQSGLAAEKTVKQESRGWAYELISFEQIMEKLFGKASDIAARLVEGIRMATYARTDAVRQKRQEWQGAMRKIFSAEKSWGDIQEKLWDYAQTDSKEAMSVGWRKGRKETKIEVPLDIAMRAVTGTAAQQKALGFDHEEVMRLERLLDENQALEPRKRRDHLTLARLDAGTATATPLSQNQAVGLTMLAKQKDYQEALSFHGWTPEVIAEIESKLTAEAKAIRTWLSTQYRDGYKSINAVFQRMFGAPLPQIDNYSPGTWEALNGEAVVSPEGDGAFGMGGLSASAMKTRRIHRAAPRLADAMVTYWQHVGTTEHFKAFADPVREIRGTILRPEVRASITEKGGAKALGAVTDWVKVFENDGIKRAASLGALQSFHSRLQNAVAIGALAWNVGTLAKQSLAALGSAYEMTTGAYLSGFSRLMRGKLDFSGMLKSEAIRRRIEAGATPELRQVMSGMMGQHPGSNWLTRGGRAFANAGMDFLGETDGFFTAASAAIYFDYAKREAIASGLSDEQAALAAMQRTEGMIDRTAQPIDLMNRSLYEVKAAANPSSRWMFMFASEARQKAALYGMSLGRIVKGQGTAQDARVMLISHVVAPLILQTIVNIISDWRDDDDKELFDMEHWSPLRYVKAMMLGPLMGIPLIGGAANTIFSQATGQPSFENDPTNPLGSLIAKFIGGSLRLAKGSNHKDDPLEQGVNAAKVALNLTAAAAAISPVGQGAAWLGMVGNAVDQAFDMMSDLISSDK